MTFSSIEEIAISGICVFVPKEGIDNNDNTGIFTEKTLKKAIKTTGIQRRRIANDETCASDLCYAAASKLLSDMNIDKKTIDLVIFVSQTPDFRIPATSTLLQHRLGLPKTTAAFDVNLGCSGYVYGLSIAYSYASQSGIKRVLLLVGDTLSKFVSNKDKATTLLFGDGGSATLIEKKKDNAKAYFSLNSDGSGEEAIKIKAGGCRYPSSNESLIGKQGDDGSIKSDEQLSMDGLEVFNFTIREVPDDITRILKYANTDIKNVNYIIYHQSNKFIMDYLTEKLQYPQERVPYSLQEYGNTSCLSIPITIASALKNKTAEDKKKVILCGYGVGLSWATALVDISDSYISEILEI